MKKFILPLLLILSISLLIAAESEASDVVGYFKVDAPVGAWTPVSVPFEITDGTPLGVFGENWASDENFEVTDLIINAYSAAFTNYYTGYYWDNEDPTFVQPGHVLFINRTQPAADTNFYLLGKVNPQPISLDMAGLGAGGWSPFAINSASPIDPADLGFATTEPDWDNYYLDMIVCQNDARVAEYWGAEYGWNALDGLEFLIEPSKAYYYYSNNPTNWTWDYPSVPGRNDLNFDTKIRRTK